MSEFDVKKKVEINIYKITNTRTGYSRYKVQFWDKKAPLNQNSISSLDEAKRIKSKYLKDHPELIPQGRTSYKTIEKHIFWNDERA